MLQTKELHKLVKHELLLIFGLNGLILAWFNYLHRAGWA